MINSHDAYLLVSALVSIIALVVLIARFKVNAFIVLMTVSLALAIVTRMPPQNIVKSFEAGLGGTLGHIAIIVALGTMLGKMMAESGGADRIAQTLIQFFGERRVPWAMAAVGFLVGLPVFFEVGFVLLVPACLWWRGSRSSTGWCRPIPRPCWPSLLTMRTLDALSCSPYSWEFRLSFSLGRFMPS